MNRLATLTLWTLMAAYGVSQAQETSPATQPDTPLKSGQFTVTFSERSPLSTVKAVTQRFLAELRNPPDDYTLEDESFIVYVPESYDGAEAYGLIVWINAGPNGWPPRQYMPLLDKHKLIWVGANNSGNKRSFWHRTGLALDGLHNISKRYNIDPMRTYISGFSGGGRSSSRVGLTYPDLFAGTFPLDGVDYFTRLPHPNNTDTILRYWGPSFRAPPRKLLEHAKSDCRFVLMTGEHDGNKPQTLATYQYGLKRGKFEHVTYLEVPGKGHALPPAEWFERGIVALDAPIELILQSREESADKAMKIAMARLKRSTKAGYLALEQVINDYPQTAAAQQAASEVKRIRDDPELSKSLQDATPSGQDKLRGRLALAKGYLQADMPDDARPLLQSVIDDAPDSEEADEARALLEGMSATE